MCLKYAASFLSSVYVRVNCDSKAELLVTKQTSYMLFHHQRLAVTPFQPVTQIVCAAWMCQQEKKKIMWYNANTL